MFVGGRRLVVASCLVGLLAGVVAGCSGSASKPRSLPPLSTTPAARVTTSPALSEKAELRAATAVVREYFRLLNAPTTLATADSLAALMTTDCPCQRVVSSIREVLHKDETYFGRNTLVSVTPALDGTNTADALVQYDYIDSGIKDAAGRVLTRDSGRRGTLLSFLLIRQDHSWLIHKVLTLRKGQLR